MKDDPRLEQVEEDGDEIFTPMPLTCRRWGCDNEILVAQKGFLVCPKCQGSYGAV